MELPMLTTPSLKETLYIYLAAYKEAILNKLEVSGKLAKYAMELGVYNITYIPQNAVKGQVLADFLNETLFTDGASSLKGVGARLVLIDLVGTEYTYAIRLNFKSTNNEAEYEALLAGLRISEKRKF
ncbi:reverse transcriptase domain-containing protein [Tanacetum coccineum]